MELFYLFPISILVATFANSSGFSGGVFFQPFFYLFFDIPLHSSIANGIATETMGMSSGALGYWRQKQIEMKSFKWLMPITLVGVLTGLFLFSILPSTWLKRMVGVSVSLAALLQLIMVLKKWKGVQAESDVKKIRSWSFLSLFAGAFSSCTGTGNAELHQPLLEYKGKLATTKANATAIALEACGNITITLFNLIMSDLHWDILMYTLPGVIIGSQIGVRISGYLPSFVMKTIFGLAVLGIGIFYLITA
jgi:uncharacterized protein